MLKTEFSLVSVSIYLKNSVENSTHLLRDTAIEWLIFMRHISNTA